MSRGKTDGTDQGLLALGTHENDPAALVVARLRRCGHRLPRSIACEFHDGIAVLTGTVPTFHLKQVAQELAARTPGVQQVKNCLHVAGATGRDRRPAVAG